MEKNSYWNHNTAYYPWVMRQVKQCSRILDVGCGDGLLIEKLAPYHSRIVGLEPDKPSAQKAKCRVWGLAHVEICTIPFEQYDAAPNTLDAIVFVASLHHMDPVQALPKAKELLAPGGKLVVVGCAKPKDFMDYVIECARVVPAKIGSWVHGEKNGGKVGVPILCPAVSYAEICEIVKTHLPNARLSRRLYYRYLLTWTK